MARCLKITLSLFHALSKRLATKQLYWGKARERFDNKPRGTSSIKLLTKDPWDRAAMILTMVFPALNGMLLESNVLNKNL